MSPRNNTEAENSNRAATSHNSVPDLHCVRTLIPDVEENSDDDEYDFDVERACIGTYGRCCPVRLFPPPMSMLARTEQLRSYMPWTLLKFRYNDSRVVMKAVRTKQHQYFKASRHNGNRTLQLVSADENSPAFFTGFNAAVAHAKTNAEAQSEKQLKSPMPSYFTSFGGESITSSSSSYSMSSPSLSSSSLAKVESGADEEIINENFKTESADKPQNPGREITEDDETNATSSPSTSGSPSNASSPSLSEPAFPELCSIYDAYNGVPFTI